MNDTVWNLGHRVRTARKKRSITLKQLAEQTGLSASFLSEVERGLAQPSMGSLRKIVQALGISLMGVDSGREEAETDNGRFLFPAPFSGQLKPITDVSVVRWNQRKKLSYPGQPGFYELVTPDLNRNIEVLYLKMDPGSNSGPDPIVDLPGEKCLYILSGQGDFIMAGQPYRLEKGDSASYPANVPVSWVVGDREPMECLIIITPPGF